MSKCHFRKKNRWLGNDLHVSPTNLESRPLNYSKKKSLHMKNNVSKMYILILPICNFIFMVKYRNRKKS